MSEVGFYTLSESQASATFPSSPVPDRVSSAPIFNSTIQRAEDGSTVSVRNWCQPRLSYVLGYRDLTETEIDVLWDFYAARKGQDETFKLYEPESPATLVGNFRFVDPRMSRRLFEAALWEGSLALIQVFEYPVP